LIFAAAVALRTIFRILIGCPVLHLIEARRLKQQLLVLKHVYHLYKFDLQVDLSVTLDSQGSVLQSSEILFQPFCEQMFQDQRQVIPLDFIFVSHYNVFRLLLKLLNLS